MIRSLLIGAFATSALGNRRLILSAQNPTAGREADRTLYHSNHYARCEDTQPLSVTNMELDRTDPNYANKPDHWTAWHQGDLALGSGANYIMAAENPTVGRELFLAHPELQGDSGSVRLYKDLVPGSGSSSPSDFTFIQESASTAQGQTKFLFLAADASGDRTLHYSNGDNDAEEVRAWAHPDAKDYKEAWGLKLMALGSTRRAVFVAKGPNSAEPHLVYTPKLGVDGVEDTSAFTGTLIPLSQAKVYQCTRTGDTAGDITCGLEGVKPFTDPKHLMGVGERVGDGLFYTANVDGQRHPCFLGAENADTVVNVCYKLAAPGDGDSIVADPSAVDPTDAEVADGAPRRAYTLDAFAPITGQPTLPWISFQVCFGAVFGAGHGLLCLDTDKVHVEDPSSSTFALSFAKALDGPVTSAKEVRVLAYPDSSASSELAVATAPHGAVTRPQLLHTPTSGVTSGVVSVSGSPPVFDPVKVSPPCEDVTGFVNQYGGTCGDVDLTDPTWAIGNSPTGRCNDVSWGVTGTQTLTDSQGQPYSVDITGPLTSGVTGDGYSNCCLCAFQEGKARPADTSKIFPSDFEFAAGSTITGITQSSDWEVVYTNGGVNRDMGFTFYAELDGAGAKGLEVYFAALSRATNQITVDLLPGAFSSLPVAGREQVGCGCAVYKCQYNADDAVCFGKSHLLKHHRQGAGSGADVNPSFLGGPPNPVITVVDKAITGAPGTGARQPADLTCQYESGDNSCPHTIGKLACENFNAVTDFRAANVGSSLVRFTNNLPVDQTWLVIGNHPWDKTKTIDENGALTAPESGAPASGCMFRQMTAFGPNTITRYGPSTGFDGVACELDVITSCSESRMRVDYTLAHLVDNLDNAGRIVLYYHRIAENPIKGDGIQLLWYAENACKIYVDVEFECQGGDCVEVTTIVCANFAGINAANEGRLKIECKVPPGWDVASSGTPTNHALPYPQQDAIVANANGGHFGTGVGQYSKNFVSGRASWDFTTTSSIGAAGSIANINGDITIRGAVLAIDSTPNPTVYDKAEDWTAVLDLHTAPYNLTMGAPDIAPLNMPVLVQFYTDPTASTYADAHAQFPTCSANCEAVPFLAKQEISYGAITNSVHAFLRIIAKVSAPNHDFLNLKVTGIRHDRPPADGGNVANSLSLRQKCHVGGNVANDVDRLDGASTGPGYVHVGPNSDYPQATIKCTNFMADSTADATPNVAAGHVVVFSLQWQLRRFQGSTSGKALLLQDAPSVDPADQSVNIDVSFAFGAEDVTIELGGGADGAGSSGDNNTTYIIIGVVVAAVAVCCAGAVFAFLHMRNKAAGPNSEETQYSPAKYEVAAVYDITGPKRPTSAPIADV